MENKLIDKKYWLGFGYDLIDGGLKTLYNEISSINTYVNGLLAFYGAITILGSIYNEIESFWHYFLIVFPIALIKTVSWYANVFSRPEPIEFFPDSPQSCEWAHDRYFEQAENHLKNMKGFAFIATLLVLVGFVYLNWVSVNVKKAEDKKDAKIEMLTKKKDSLQSSLAKHENTIMRLAKLKRHNLTAEYVSADKEVVLRGNFPADKVVKTKIFDSTKDKIIHQINRIADSEGDIEISIPLDVIPKDNLLLEVEYTLSDYEKRTIKKYLSIEN